MATCGARVRACVFNMMYWKTEIIAKISNSWSVLTYGITHRSTLYSTLISLVANLVWFQPAVIPQVLAPLRHVTVLSYRN